MKNKKFYFALISLFLIAAALVALNFDRLSNLTESAEAPDSSAAPAQSTSSPTTPSSTNQINDLLRQGTQAPLASNNPEGIDDTQEDLETLQEALNDFYSAEDEQDREAALMTLGEYPDPKAKEAILYALNDPEDSVREQAVNQITSWEDEKERQQMLLTALTNDKPDIVVLTLESISELDDPALMQKIKELSNDKNEDISEAAKTALEMADFD
ncbi:HEAT repeat domain-containing protein [Methylomicrobium lacus]|uniref:HEAT repeat domain-containing protein n=1 Tax=Methylomicrobium lacus TaxID=136992 RepID=UPI00045E75EB|nr:HEAT repeat domain-containing protein [Methylomicrobium lacus]